MGSCYHQDLADALRVGQRDNAFLKPYVLRLTAAMQERTEYTDQSSIEFVISAVYSLKQLSSSICPTQCYEALACAVPYLHAHGALTPALAASYRMAVLSEHLGARNLARRAENFIGVIEKAQGNLTAAVIHYQRSLSLARELRDPRCEGLTLANLGALLIEASLYPEAKACLERASTILDNPQERAAAQYNLALLHWFRGNSREAMALMRGTLDQIWQPGTVQLWYSRAVRHAQYVYLAVELDDLAEARKHVLLCVIAQFRVERNQA